MVEGERQEGGVEGLSSPPVVKTPKSQLAVQQPLTKSIKPTRKVSLHPKKRPPLDGRRGALAI